MSIRRITISVAEPVADRIKKAAGSKPVSTWVTDLIEEHLDSSELERLWDEFYTAVNPSAGDVRRAEAIHKKLTGRPRRRGAA